jgi:DNA-binding beta-propeller fold protein YncE
MRTWTRLSAAVGLLILIAACAGSGESTETSTTTGAEPSTTAVGPGESDPAAPETSSAAGTSPAPEFPTGLDWLNTSEPLTMDQLRGKVVLLDFWTYGCINCIHIIPDLERLETEYPDELVVIGVHSAKFVNESATENIRQVILRYGVEHPVVNDRDFEVWRAWGAQAWPTVVLVDPDGNVVGGHAGEGVYDVVAPFVASLVEEFGAEGRLDPSPIPLAPEAERQPSRILSFPGKVHVAPDDSRIFVADTGHHRIVVADRTTGEVLAVYGSGVAGFADGAGPGASFDAPQGMILDDDGVTLYVADTNNHAIREIDTETGAVTTLLGTGSIGWPPLEGTAPDVAINSPWDVLVDGDTLYIAMAGHHQIWSMDLVSGIAAPLVGSAQEGVLNGPLDQAELAQPSGLAIDDGGHLYFADSESSSIRSADVLSPAGVTALVAGGDADLFRFGDTDGVGDEARFQHPLGVAVWEPEEALLVADTYNSRIRRIDPVTREVTTLLGAGHGWADGPDPRFYEPGGLSIDGDTLYVADTNNHAVRVVDLPTGDTSTLVLKGIEKFQPSADDEDFAGVIASLPPVAVARGPGEIVLDLRLPDGYKLNDEAPSSLAITGDAVVVDGVVDLTGVDTLPLTIPGEVVADGDLVADLTAVYCRDDAESLCLIEQVRFRVPVEVADVGTTPIVLEHAIDLPPEANG